MKIANIYFSTSGESEKVAHYYASKLNCQTIDLTPATTRKNFDFSQQFDLSIITFPVHCQNIPIPFKSVLPKIKANYFIINITYGKMSFGNCLADAAKLLRGKIIGASLIPAKHTYLDEPSHKQLYRLDDIIERIPLKQEIRIPHFPRHILANFFPVLRSQIGIKIIQSDRCTKCNLCTNHCPTESIVAGTIKKHKCIRCLKCIYVCPEKVLDFKVRKPLKYYLRKERENRFIIF